MIGCIGEGLGFKAEASKCAIRAAVFALGLQIIELVAIVKLQRGVVSFQPQANAA